MTEMLLFFNVNLKGMLKSSSFVPFYLLYGYFKMIKVPISNTTVLHMSKQQSDTLCHPKAKKDVGEMFNMLIFSVCFCLKIWQFDE